MRTDHLTNFIFKHLTGGYCPRCGEWYEPNGTGPAGETKIKRAIRWLLKRMPLDDILQELAVPFHDWRCHLGKCAGNLSFKETTAEFKENIKIAVKKWVRKGPNWYRRLGRKALYYVALQFMDDIYAYAVGSTSMGEKAYDQNSCEVDG